MIPNDDRIVSYNDIRVLPDEIWNDIIQFIGPINNTTNKQIATVCKHLLAIWRSGVKAIHITLNDQQKFSLVRNHLVDEFPHLRRARISDVGYDNSFSTDLGIVPPTPHPNELNIELEFDTGNSIREAADILSQCPELANLVVLLSISRLDHPERTIVNHRRGEHPSYDSDTDDSTSEEFQSDTHQGEIAIQPTHRPSIADIVAVARLLPRLKSLWIQDFTFDDGPTDNELTQLLSLPTRHHLWLYLFTKNLTAVGINEFSKSELETLEISGLTGHNGPAILEAISRMPHLETLILNACKLEHDYSAAPGEWKNLKCLTIRNCQPIQRFLPAFVDRLTELETLALMPFDIAMTPSLAAISELPKLTHLFLFCLKKIDQNALGALLAELPCIKVVTVCHFSDVTPMQCDAYAYNLNQQKVLIQYRLRHRR